MVKLTDAREIDMNELYEGEASEGARWVRALTAQEISEMGLGTGLVLEGLTAYWFRTSNETFALMRAADGWWHGGLTDLEGD